MKIIVDADACPVKEIIEQQARLKNIKVIMVSNYSHQINSQYAEVIVVDKESQAADITIANMTAAGDLIVTQDYGLASIVLGKGAVAMSPSGKQYNVENIDGLLMQRYLNAKARQAGNKHINPKKRTRVDNTSFENSLKALLDQLK